MTIYYEAMEHNTADDHRTAIAVWKRTHCAKMVEWLRCLDKAKKYPQPSDAHNAIMRQADGMRWGANECFNAMKEVEAALAKLESTGDNLKE